MKTYSFKYIILLLPVFLFHSCKLYECVSEKGNTPVKTKVDTIYIEKDIVVDSIIIEPQLSESDEEIDSFGIVEQLLSDTTLVSKIYKNRFGKNHRLQEDNSMTYGSSVLKQLDSLANEKIFKKYIFESAGDTPQYREYAGDEVPQFSDSIYALRIEMLNVQTPIRLEYNQYVKSFINIYAGKNRKLTSLLLGLKEIYFPLFEQVLDKYDLPLELKYLAVVESALNPRARSRAGAKGLWQFMYGTGKRYGLKETSLIDERFDPLKATDAAARHLKDLYDIYGDWQLAMAAYNSGPGNVNRAIYYAGGVKDYWAIWPFLPQETRGYVPAFIAVNYVMNYAPQHNIRPLDPGIIFDNIDSVTVKDVLSLEQVAEFMNIDIDDLRFLDPLYRHDIIPASDSQTYTLYLPRDKTWFFIEHEQEIYKYKTKKGIEKEKLLAKIKKLKERTIHIVRIGENLGLIARKYHTSVKKIKRWNSLRSSRIYPGQKLVIFSYADNSRPSRKSKKKSTGTKYRYHVIKSGDTLWELSRKYNCSVSQIKKWNGIRNSHRLKPGDKIIIGRI